MKKKIGIITLNGYYNYGNRLQNYAMEKILNEYDYETYSLIEFSKDEYLKESKLKVFLKANLEEKINLVKYKINKKSINQLREKRERFFKNFTLENINEIEVELEKINENYEYFITGSDQVWHPNTPKVMKKNFLDFTEKGKRISYAPSFGVSEIRLELKKEYKKLINGINKLSVREEAGAKIIKGLTGRDAHVLVDPTMLLNKEEWLKVAKEDKNKPKKDYLLTYFLGGIPKEYKKYIKKVAKENNLEIVDLANIKVSKYYVNGPSEFIDYINSAKLFMTDSFHGCVFSVLMETPFIVCKRAGHSKNEDMYSRIDTFVKKFKLENREFENLTEDKLFKINYSESYKILEIERKKSFKFLEDALNINNLELGKIIQ